jgi:hypothetical protein
MSDQLASVTERIILLLERLERGESPGRKRLEDALTDGYACALWVDAECDRIERRIAEQAAALADENGEEQTRRISSLAQLLARRRRELASLRSLLTALRAGVQEARVA